MKNNWIKIYSIIISGLAVVLLVGVILLSGVHDAGRSDIQEQVTAETESDSDSVNETATFVQPVIEEETSDESEYNVGGLVGWEQGNDDSLNIVNAWKNSLAQMNLDLDVAFLGDSITQRCDFNQYFPDKKVINLGCGGDTIRGVANRAGMAGSVKAGKVFVLCGVNQLRNDNIDYCRTEYAGLLNALMEAAPDADCYVCSILPISQGWQDGFCRHEVTEEFNEIIKKLAQDRGMTYVDLYSLFVLDDAINPEYTIDGVHLSQAGFDLWMNTVRQYVYD